MGRLTRNQLATMYSGYGKARKHKPVPASITTEVPVELETADLKVPCRESLRHWVKKWDQNGGNFTESENRAYTAKGRKL